MCHGDDSRPPAAPRAVPASSAGPVVLTASDGNRVLAHQARPASATGVGTVVLPDVRGLHGYYRQLAVRFAETGAESLNASSIFTVGFCLGGGYSWRQSADTPGLSGAVGFYGRPAAATEVLRELRAPLLMLVAGADAAIPLADTALLAAAAGERVDVERVVFDDAPHSFFERSFAEHKTDCVRAWQVIGQFVEAHR